MTQRFEHATRGRAHRRLIFHEQDTRVRRSLDRFYNRPRNAFNFTGFSREVELETAALAWRHVDHDLASTLGDDAVHGSQPQTGPASTRFGREEGFEDALVCRGRHAFARVATGDADVVAAYDVRVCRTVVCSE